MYIYIYIHTHHFAELLFNVERYNILIKCKGTKTIDKPKDGQYKHKQENKRACRILRLSISTLS